MDPEQFVYSLILNTVLLIRGCQLVEVYSPGLRSKCSLRSGCVGRAGSADDGSRAEADPPLSSKPSMWFSLWLCVCVRSLAYFCRNPICRLRLQSVDSAQERRPVMRAQRRLVLLFKSKHIFGFSWRRSAYI